VKIFIGDLYRISTEFYSQLSLEMRRAVSISLPRSTIAGFLRSLVIIALD